MAHIKEPIVVWSGHSVEEELCPQCNDTGKWWVNVAYVALLIFLWHWYKNRDLYHRFFCCQSVEK